MTQRQRSRTGTIWFRRISSRPASAGARRRRPDLEPLESRRLLATIAEISAPTGLAAGPDRITTGLDNNLYFTEYNSGQIGMVDPATQKVTEFPLPARNSQPFDITAGPDGNIWFTEFATSQIGMLNTATHVITEYSTPTLNAEPYDITAGPKGSDTVWFTEWNVNQIGVMNVGTGKITEYAIPTPGAVPEGITVGPGGNIWFSETMAGRIGMFNPASDKFTEYALGDSTAQPDGITAGAGGIWFTEYAGDQIGMIDPTTGVFAAPIQIAAVRTEPTEITVGPDGYLWFTQAGSSQIGILNSSTHAITELSTPTPAAGPRGITTGPDGNVWFAELSTGKVGVVTPDLNIVLTGPPPSTLTAGSAFGLTASIEYDSGIVDTHYTGDVTVGLSGDPGSSLGGTLTVPASAGVAAFSSLTLDSTGTETLHVGAAGMAGPISTSVDVSPPAVVVISVPPNSPASPPPVTVASTTPPSITREVVLTAGKGRRKHVVGFKLSFNAPLNPASAANAANYEVTKTTKRRREKSVVPIHLQVAYDATDETVSLMLAGRPRFTQGGQIVVSGVPPTGVAGASGDYLAGSGGTPGSEGIFRILPNARGVVTG
jgi:virginiamycin B lyase